MRSYQRSVLGVTLILLAIQVVVTARIPRPIGFIMALSGVAYLAQGFVVGAEGFSANGSVPGLAAFVFDLAWMIWLVIAAWQKSGQVQPQAAARAVTT